MLKERFTMPVGDALMGSLPVDLRQERIALFSRLTVRHQDAGPRRLVC
jgi:hypothetical protein